MDEGKSQVDRLLDLAVFAPLGFLLTRDEAVVDLAAAGRKQVAFTRSLGQAALKGLARAAASPQPAHAANSAVAAAAQESSRENVVVDGYEAMTARQVVALVRSCDQAQADWIRQAETASKQRVTVLRALDERSRS